MKAEYYPPKEDVILQNEAPTDFYILVSGAVVIFSPCKHSIHEESISFYKILINKRVNYDFRPYGLLKVMIFVPVV